MADKPDGGLSLLSAYDRRARFVPGALAIAPVVATAAALGFKDSPVVGAVVAFLSLGGGAYLLAWVVASMGQSAEQKLLTDWGGWPTTQLLRLRAPAENPVQRDLWRAAITTVTRINLLDEAAEQQDPATADHTIGAAVGLVLPLGHGSGDQVVFAHNIGYGLQRNLYAIRRVGRVIATTCAAGLGIALGFPHSFSRPAVVVGLVITGVVGFIWFVLPSAERTRNAGVRYATQLFNAVARQASNPNSAPPAGGAPRP